MISQVLDEGYVPENSTPTLLGAGGGCRAIRSLWTNLELLLCWFLDTFRTTLAPDPAPPFLHEGDFLQTMTAVFFSVNTKWLPQSIRVNPEPLSSL